MKTVRNPNEPEGLYSFRFSTHTQVMLIAVVVLTVMFFLSYYYTVSEERTHQLERIVSKEAYISRLLSLYYLRSKQVGNKLPLRGGLDTIIEDDDVARLRVLAGGLDLQAMAQGFRPERVLRRTTVLYDERALPAGQIIIDFWRNPVTPAASKLTLINLVIIGDMLVLFGLALHLLLREIVTRPLENFVEATKRIAHGNLDSYLEGPLASREQERLAVSFNYMLDHLRDYRDRLQRANEELEERVVRRTLQLEHEKNRSEAIVTSVADGVYTIDEDWQIVTFNPAAEKITGQTAAEVFGQKCYDVMKYPFCETRCLLKRLPREDRIFDREIYVEEFEKKGASFIVSGAPLYDASSRRVGGVESIKDITYVKQLHDQIRQADKLSSIGILAAGVAHEINNPLSNIRLYTQILTEDGGSEAASAQSSLKNILQETDRATKIVRNLLEFSRQGMPEFQKTSVREVVRSAIDILHHQLKLDKVEIVEQIPDNLPSIWADFGNLQQVFINLMTNAKHAMRPRGGELRIRAWHDSIAQKVLVSVADSGFGIEPQNLDRIFDPFFTTKEVGEGTGLGLAISYGIVKDHGGDIRVKSRPGEGAEFTVSLPPALA